MTHLYTVMDLPNQKKVTTRKCYLLSVGNSRRHAFPFCRNILSVKRTKVSLTCPSLSVENNTGYIQNCWIEVWHMYCWYHLTKKRSWTQMMGNSRGKARSKRWVAQNVIYVCKKEGKTTFNSRKIAICSSCALTDSANAACVQKEVWKYHQNLLYKLPCFLLK